MIIPLLKRLSKFINKHKQTIFIVGTLLTWTGVIFFKQGGQSLLVHYMWPSIVFVNFCLICRFKMFKNNFSILHLLAILSVIFFFITFITDLSPSDGSLELMNISGGILLAIVLSQLNWNRNKLMLLFVIMIITISIVDVWGIISYATAHPFNRLAGPLMKPHEAFAGFPNLAANLNLMILIPAFYLFVESLKKKGIHKISFFIVNILILASLVLTYSRAAWASAGLVIAIAAIVLLIKYRKNAKESLTYIKSGVLVVLISLLLVTALNGVRSMNEETESIQDKIAFQSGDEGSSIEERIASFERGIQMVKSYPLTGVGAGSFNYISQSSEQDFSTLSSYPYSLPVKIVAEHGVIVFLLLVAWLVSVIVKGLRSDQPYTLVAALTLAILLIHHSIDNNFDFFAASLPFFILTGFIWKPTKKKSTINNGWLLGLVLLITLVGLAFVTYEGWYGRYYVQGRNAAGSGNHEEAYKKYEQSESLIFERDAKLATALSAWELYKNSDQIKWLEKAKSKASSYRENENPLDRRGSLLLARIDLEQKNYPECLEWVYDAQTIGGENYFEADYYELLCLQGSNEQVKIEEFAANIKPKLEKYLELLKVNSHMAVLTDNPKFAIYILEELKENSDDFTTLYEEMYETGKMELEKFHQKYGIEAESIYK
ncbi:O-antigen ligase family protein [Patescibacteria group bacterium]